MRGFRLRRSPYLIYCLLAVLLLGCYVALNGFQVDNSATMAPTLTFDR